MNTDFNHIKISKTLKQSKVIIDNWVCFLYSKPKINKFVNLLWVACASWFLCFYIWFYTLLLNALYLFFFFSIMWYKPCLNLLICFTLQVIQCILYSYEFRFLHLVMLDFKMRCAYRLMIVKSISIMGLLCRKSCN